MKFYYANLEEIDEWSHETRGVILRLIAKNVEKQLNHNENIYKEHEIDSSFLEDVLCIDEVSSEGLAQHE